MPRECFHDVVRTISAATSQGGDLKVLARLINASRDRELTPAFPSLPFVVTFFSFFLRSSTSLPLTPPESVSRTRKEALSGVKWWVRWQAVRVKRIVYDEREDISGKPEGGKKKGYTRRHTRSISFAPEARFQGWTSGGERSTGVLLLVAWSPWNSHGNFADRFLDYFDLRLLYIARWQRVTPRLDIPRSDTLSAADNLLALRAENAKPCSVCSPKR